MLKSITFGLLAAALTIVPSTAFAGQVQESNQINTQQGAAINGSINSQTNTNSNNQVQVSNRSASGRHTHAPRTSQVQRSNQDSQQTGAAEDGSINRQNNRNDNNQRQFENVRVRRGH
jgi:hypothetical protein